MDSVLDRASLPQGPAKDTAAPSALIKQLRHAAIPVAICAVLGGAGAYFYASGLPKSYTAEGIVAVEADHMAIPELQGALRTDNSPDPLPLVHTEVQALSARQLVEQVSTRMHLERDSEFNGSLLPPTTFAKLKNWLKSRAPGSAGSADINPNALHDSILGAVQHNLVISQDNRSLVIGISFNAHDPKLAAEFVNNLITDYIDSRAQRRVSANEGASAVVSQRIEQVRTDIERIEKKMRDLRESSGLVGTRAGSVGQQQVEDLATAASRATLDRSEIEANWERASALASGGSSDALASVLGSSTISRLREQESQAASKVADLEQRYGSNYPALKSAQADLAATRREIGGETHRIVASLATQLKVARAHEADVLTQLAQAHKAGVSAQNTQAQLDQLQQDAATRRELYRTLLERAQQTATTPQSSETPDVRVLSKASPPGLPSAPNVKMAAAFGGIGGALLACMAALAFTQAGFGAADAAGLARAQGLQTIATLRGRRARSLADRLLQTGIGPEVDALRAARARLAQLSRMPLRVAGFVGAQQNTTATSVACAFARCAARDGQHVLLIDQDPRSLSMSRVLGEPTGRLTDVLNGTLCWRDGVVADRIPGLDTLVGAATAENPHERQVVGLENLLVEARAEYDLIVLGAPAGADADATRIARSSDVTVIVLDEAQMRPRAASETCARLQSFSRAPLAALLLLNRA